MPLSTAQWARLRAFARAAVAAERKHLYPAEVIVALWSGESDWGEDLTGLNNPFGITRAKRHQSASFVRTTEYLTNAQIKALPERERASITSKLPTEKPGVFKIRLSRAFADFLTLEDAIADKVGIITGVPRYQPAWQAWQQSRDWRALLVGIADAGYATSPGYKRLLLALSRMREIHQAIAEARQASQAA